MLKIVSCDKAFNILSADCTSNSNKVPPRASGSDSNPATSLYPIFDKNGRPVITPVSASICNHLSLRPLQSCSRLISLYFTVEFSPNFSLISSSVIVVDTSWLMGASKPSMLSDTSIVKSLIMKSCVFVMPVAG